MISLKNLSYQYGNRNLFQNLTFEFPKGQLVLLTGDSGSGKSTLMRLIAGFAELAYTGEILVDGKSLMDTSMAKKSEKVGMMFQIPSRQFTMSTLRKEMIFALENQQVSPYEITKRIQRAVSEINLQGLLDRPLNQLSGGEKQKAAMAVLLAMDSEVLLLDEPFASIDPKSRRELIQLLAQLRDIGKTIIVSDHDWSDYSAVIDRWVTLNEGRLVGKDTQEFPKIPSIGSLAVAAPGTTSDTLNFQQVGYIGRKGMQLLKPADFTFQKGITTITGANGSGKTTLLRSIAQRHKYQGEMFFHERRLKPHSGLYNKLSFAVQDAQKQFVALTVAEELAYGENYRSDAKEKQNEALEKLGLDGKASLFHLSEGQKKMVQLIAMLSQDLDLLLLDEPFTGLDDQVCKYFVEWISQQAKHQDFLIVSHRLAPLAGISHHHVTLSNQQLIKEDV